MTVRSYSTGALEGCWLREDDLAARWRSWKVLRTQCRGEQGAGEMAGPW